MPPDFPRMQTAPAVTIGSPVCATSTWQAELHLTATGLETTYVRGLLVELLTPQSLIVGKCAAILVVSFYELLKTHAV